MEYKGCHLVARALRGEIDAINGPVLSTRNRLETAEGRFNNERAPGRLKGGKEDTQEIIRETKKATGVEPHLHL